MLTKNSLNFEKRYPVQKRTHTTSVATRKFELTPDYYALEAVGYKNYKYPKARNTSPGKPRKVYSQNALHRETLENCIQNIHNQKILLENLKNQDDFIDFGTKQAGDSFPKANNEEYLCHQTTSYPLNAKRNNLKPINQNYLEGKFVQIQTRENLDIDEENEPTARQKKNLYLENDQKNLGGPLRLILKKEFLPDLKRIIVNKKQSFNVKHLKMEFEHFSKISQKYLENCKQKSLEKRNSQNDYQTYQLNYAIKGIYF